MSITVYNQLHRSVLSDKKSTVYICFSIFFFNFLFFIDVRLLIKIIVYSFFINSVLLCNYIVTTHSCYYSFHYIRFTLKKVPFLNQYFLYACIFLKSTRSSFDRRLIIFVLNEKIILYVLRNFLVQTFFELLIVNALMRVSYTNSGISSPQGTFYATRDAGALYLLATSKPTVFINDQLKL